MGRKTAISTAGMTREEWLAERRHSLGGSDMGAILGLNRWRSPYTVWADKMGLLPEQEDSEAMRIGRDLEPYVLRRFCEASGKKTRHVNAILRNLDYPHLHANVDSMIVGENAGVEAKTASALNARAFGGGEFPESYYAQCVTYMAVTESDRWYLAVLIMGREFKVFQLTRVLNDVKPDWCESSVYVSEKEISALNDVAASFWALVEAGTPPDADGLRSTTETLDTIYREEEGPELDLDAVNGSVIALTAINSRIKELQTMAEARKNEIKDFMRDACRASSDLGTVTWKEQTRRTFDEKRFRADHPEMDLAGYYKTTTSRVFRFVPAKKKGEENNGN